MSEAQKENSQSDSLSPRAREAQPMTETVNDAIRRIMAEGGTPFQLEQRLTRYVLAALAPPAPEAAREGWQPIATVPKDVDVLIAVGHVVGEARFHSDSDKRDGGDWWWAGEFGAHHADPVNQRTGWPQFWMPLPAPPTEDAK